MQKCAMALKIQITKICSSIKSGHLMNFDGMPRIIYHTVACHTVEGAFQGHKISAVQWLHCVVCAMWRQSQTMDTVCSAMHVFHNYMCLMTMMPIKNDDMRIRC